MTRRELVAGALSLATLQAKSRLRRSSIAAITDEIGKTPEDALDFARRYELSWIELRGVPSAAGGRKEYAFLPEAEVKAAAASFAARKLKVSFLNTSLLKFGFPGTEPVRRRPEAPEARAKRLEGEQKRFDRRMEDLKHAIRSAHILGADKIRVFTGTRAAEPAALFPRIADLIGEMALVAEREKVSLLVENEGSCNVGSSAELAAFIKLLPSKAVGINWDPQNELGLKQVPFPDGYALIPKKRLLNVQIKGKGVMPSSTERLDWKGILQALNKDGYTGRIGLETHIFDGTLIEAAHVSMKEILRIVDEL